MSEKLITLVKWHCKVPPFGGKQLPLGLSENLENSQCKEQSVISASPCREKQYCRARERHSASRLAIAIKAHIPLLPYRCGPLFHSFLHRFFQYLLTENVTEAHTLVA